jgi:hypothetical protein
MIHQNIMKSLLIDTSCHGNWNELILLEVAVEGLVNVSTKYIHLSCVEVDFITTCTRTLTGSVTELTKLLQSRLITCPDTTTD